MKDLTNLISAHLKFNLRLCLWKNDSKFLGNFKCVLTLKAPDAKTCFLNYTLRFVHIDWK